MKRLFILAAAAALAAGVAACSGGAGNGSTSCGSFRSMSSSDQASTVKNMISSHNGSTSPANVDLTLASVSAYCLLHSGSDPIDGIYSG